MFVIRIFEKSTPFGLEANYQIDNQ